ncbi:hypothetical protein ACJX0J_034869 [Zea mays]
MSSVSGRLAAHISFNLNLDSAYIAIKGKDHHVIELSAAKFLLSSVVTFFLLLEITRCLLGATFSGKKCMFLCIMHVTNFNFFDFLKYAFGTILDHLIGDTLRGLIYMCMWQYMESENIFNRLFVAIDGILIFQHATIGT